MLKSNWPMIVIVVLLAIITAWFGGPVAGESALTVQLQMYAQQLRANWVQAVASFLTLAAVGGAVFYVRRTAVSARRSMRDGQRAFVAPKEFVESRVRHPETGEVERWRFCLLWENTGPTAAKRCEAQLAGIYYASDSKRRLLGLPPKPLPEWFYFGDDVTARKVAFSLPPQGEGQAGPFELGLEQMRQVAGGVARLYLYGWIQYVDVFERVHESRICVELVGFTGDLGGDEPISLRYSQFPTFNCADDECAREDMLAYSRMPDDVVGALRAGGWIPRHERDQALHL